MNQLELTELYIKRFEINPWDYEEPFKVSLRGDLNGTGQTVAQFKSQSPILYLDRLNKYASHIDIKSDPDYQELVRERKRLLENPLDRMCPLCEAPKNEDDKTCSNCVGLIERELNERNLA